MNLSSLSGESLAAILPENSTYQVYSLSGTGVIVNITGKGLFKFGNIANNTVKITVDGVVIFNSITVANFANLFPAGQFDGANATLPMQYKSSLKIEIVNYGQPQNVIVAGA